MLENRAEIESALESLHKLLENETSSEDEYQDWFETHEVVFRSLTIPKAIPHPRLIDYDDEELVPDFMVQQLNSTWEIFELKLPYEKLVKDKTKRNTLYAKINGYISQCFDYAKFFEDQTNRQNFFERYQIEIPEPPRSKLVVGREDGLDRWELNRHLDGFARNVDILTYDDIIRHLEFYRFTALGEYEGLPGLAIYLVANIQKTTYENYIVSFGKYSDYNNVSIYVNRKAELCFKILDFDGNETLIKVNQEKSNLKFGQPNYFVFELGVGDNDCVMSIEINGSYGAANRVNSVDLDLDELNSNLVIGSDVKGNKRSKFFLYEHVVWKNTFNLEMRTTTRDLVFERYFNEFKRPDKYFDFQSDSFMYVNSHENFTRKAEADDFDLVQIEESKQPSMEGKGIPEKSTFVSVIYNQTKSKN